MKKQRNLHVFLGRTALLFCNLTWFAFIFFSYLGQSQGTFIYNEF